MSSVRQILSSELKKKKEVHRAYTMKVFAKEIGLAPSTLSEILKGNKGLSVKRAKHISKQLNFDHERSQLFENLAMAEYSRSARKRQLGRKLLRGEANENRSYKDLDRDKFATISDWQHGAIMELAQTTPCKATPEFIAERLNISVSKAEQSLDRLKRIGLIQIKHGQLDVLETDLEVLPGSADRAIRNHHSQLLEKAQSSVNNEVNHKRVNQSLICRVDPDNLPLAQKLISEFWEKFDREVCATENSREVYALNLNFFPLSGNNSN